jgi:peroxiredoxin
MDITTGARRTSARTRTTGRAGLWLTVGGILITLLFVAAGWLVLRSQSVTPVQVIETGSAQVGALPARGSGPLAPDFTVPTLEGGTFTLSAQRGKPVILFIMAYWCASCVPEAQALARLHQRYGDRVTIVALDVDPSSTPESLQKFREWVGQPDYIWAFDRGNRVAQAYQIRALDTTFIFNQAGQIVYSDASPTPYQTLEEQIRKLLE